MSFFKHQGLSFYYEDRGSGEVLVFLHGLGSSTLDWEDQLRYFEKSYRVIAVDMRGHGRSDKPHDTYTIPLMASHVVALLEWLEIPHYSLIGLSMGGMIAFQIATDYPERLERMVILNSAPEFLNDNLTVKSFIRQRKLMIRTLGFRYFCRVMAERLFPEEGQAGLRNKFLERWLTNDSRAYRKAFNALIDWSVKSRLHRINAPVLVLGAEWDYTSEEFKRDYTKLIAHGLYQTIPGSRHMSTLDQPDKVNEQIQAFLVREDMQPLKNYTKATM
jgi:pimeloyl-ACP methyl ester carboxylesterase